MATQAIATQAATRSHDAHNTVVLVFFTALTNLADGVLKVALPLLAITLTSSPLAVSGVAMTLTLPWLLTALHIGVLVDRFDRRRLLWVAGGLRLAVLGTLLVTLPTGAVGLPLLYVGGAALGVAEVLAATSTMALTPDAVGPRWRDRANAWVVGAETVCGEFAGPLVGGLLVASGAAFALGATALGYVGATVLLLVLVGRFRAPRPAASAGVGAEIRDGLRCLWNDPLLRLLALVLTVLCSCWGAWLAVMPLYATTTMGLGPAQWGLVLSALGVGGLVGALSVTALNRLVGRRWALFADILGTLAMVAAPALTTHVWVVAAGAFLGGMGGTLWAVNARTIAQQLVPAHLMGRYSAAARLFSWGAMPIGAGLVGLLGEVVGLPVAFGIFAAAVLVTVVPFLRVATPAQLARV